MTDKDDKEIISNVINLNAKAEDQEYSALVEALTTILQMDKYMMYGVDMDTGESIILSNGTTAIEQLGILESAKFAVASVEEEEA